jgi:hypothetical protein
MRRMGRVRGKWAVEGTVEASVGALASGVTSHAGKRADASGRRAQNDARFEVTPEGNAAPEHVRQLGSNPVAATCFRKKLFDQNVEGLSIL